MGGAPATSGRAGGRHAFSQPRPNLASTARWTSVTDTAAAPRLWPPMAVAEALNIFG